MSEAKRIKTALVSVYHKEGLDEIITKLHDLCLWQEFEKDQGRTYPAS